MAGGGEDENMEALNKAEHESSDDDIEIVPKSVDNYWLEHGNETPVSFATLPYFKTGEEPMPDKVVYVRGMQDNGMRLYVRAVSWKLEFTERIQPVFHLKTEKYWIQLLKPRKSYEETIRSIMSAAQFLNYAFVNPTDSERVAWSHVKDIFTSWEVIPSRSDLPSHLPVIRHLIASYDRLASASALQTIDTGGSKKRLASAIEDGQQGNRKGLHVSDDGETLCVEPELNHEEKKGNFEVDDINLGEEMDGYGSEPDEVGDLSETVCCICDNGGAVICCDGPCMRSFHLNKDADGAPETHCSTLGFSKGEAERMEKFFCPNCKFNIHQCYACGQLGCSSAGPAQEVFVCDAAMCGHFYHPSCVAVLILKDKDRDEIIAMVESIKEGSGFVCPMHKCLKCGKGEVKEDEDLQFGICRRCPRVWHRKCLPSYLVPEKQDEDEDEERDDEEQDTQRAWDDLLPNRILLYCKRHAIIPKLGTPARSHVKFPECSLPSAKKKLVKSKIEVEERKRKLSKLCSVKNKDESSHKATMLQDMDAGKKRELVSCIGQIKLEGRGPAKSKLGQDGLVPRAKVGKQSSVIVIKGRADVVAKANWSNLGKEDLDVKLERTSSMAAKAPCPRESVLHQLQQKSSKLLVGKAVVIDSETRSMVDDIFERAKALVTIESVINKHEVPGCYKRYSRNLDKKYSLFKIESIMRGMRKALETLENGGNIEDAKAKCSPDFIKFIDICRHDLRVYLSPFLHGARYTSYGRHFTKTEKLDEIVDRLQWYIERGDMIVDFCCGANEFSLRMKKKLEDAGKMCEYKNFDLIQTNG